MSDPTDAVQVQLAKLRVKYGLALPGKIDGLTAAVVARDESAYRLAHTLAGSSGTYGFPEIGDAARILEAILKELLESRAPLSPGRKVEVDGLLASLRTLAGEAARKVSA
jgi:HPt (histidine-containing phosphotransfer) domain-containing protein